MGDAYKLYNCDVIDFNDDDDDDLIDDDIFNAYCNESDDYWKDFGGAHPKKPTKTFESASGAAGSTKDDRRFIGTAPSVSITHRVSKPKTPLPCRDAAVSDDISDGHRTSSPPRDGIPTVSPTLETPVTSVLTSESPKCAIATPDYASLAPQPKHSTPRVTSPDPVRPYSCEVCDKRFRSHQHLSDHRLIHTGEKPHKCPVCEKGFRQKSHLNQHINTHTKPKQTHECPTCGRLFQQKASLIQHQKTHNKADMKDEKQHHDVTDFDLGVFYSDDDDVESVTGGVVETHDAGNDVYRDVAKDHDDMPPLEPIETVATGASFKRQFTSPSTSSTTPSFDDTDEERAFVCDFCNRRFAKQVQLTAHRTIHIDIRPYHCSNCSKTFRQKMGLANHQRACLKRAAKRLFSCQYCPQQFKSETAQLVHEVLHTEKPRTAGVATASSSASTSFDAVDVTEHFTNDAVLGDSSFLSHSSVVSEAEVREKLRFMDSKTILDSWLKLDDDSCPYQCKICRHSFVSMSSMRQHLMRHADYKLFSCHLCKQSFNRYNLLQQHLKICHPNATANYRCLLCDVSCRNEAEYVTHITSCLGLTQTHDDNPATSGTKSTMDFARLFDLGSDDVILDAPLTDNRYDGKAYTSAQQSSFDAGQQSRVSDAYGNGDVHCMPGSAVGGTLPGSAIGGALPESAIGGAMGGLQEPSVRSAEASAVGRQRPQRMRMKSTRYGDEFSTFSTIDAEALDASYGGMTDDDDVGLLTTSAPGIDAPVNDAAVDDAAGDDVAGDDDATKSKWKLEMSDFELPPEFYDIKHLYAKQETEPAPTATQQQHVPSAEFPTAAAASHVSSELDSRNCNHCRRVFDTRSDLETHKCTAAVMAAPVHHSDDAVPEVTDFPCDSCADVFKTNIDLAKHAAVHQTDCFTCLLCEDAFDTDSELIRHIDKSHSESSTVCNVCNKTFASIRSLIAHKSKGHSLQSIFQCRFCPKTFKAKWYKTLHEKYHTNERNHECPICRKRFVRKNDLNTHILRHGEPRFACEQCGYLFKTRVALNVHRRSQHPVNPNLFRCPVCNMSFGGEKQLERHARRHDENREMFPCEYCDKTFTTKSSSRDHMRIHRNERNHVCDTCGKAFVRRCDLRAHLPRHSDYRPHTCPQCPRTFKSRAALREHAIEHDPDRYFKCEHCDKRFPTRGQRKSHVYTDHSEIEARPRYECDVCGKTVISSDYLKLHMKRHLNQRDHICSECGQGFVRKSDLTAHMRTHTGERPYSCEVCGKCYASRQSFKDHRLTHTEPMAWECDVCSKKFRKEAALKSHAVCHTGEKKFACDVCDKRFARSCALYKHRRGHDAVQRFICPVCERGFPMKHLLTTHMKRHAGVKDHVCQVCGFATTTKAGLKNHMQYVHSSEKPFKCEFCDKAFVFRTDRRKHMRTHSRDGLTSAAVAAGGTSVPRRTRKPGPAAKQLTPNENTIIKQLPPPLPPPPALHPQQPQYSSTLRTHLHATSPQPVSSHDAFQCIMQPVAAAGHVDMRSQQPQPAHHHHHPDMHHPHPPAAGIAADYAYYDRMAATFASQMLNQFN